MQAVHTLMLCTPWFLQQRNLRNKLPTGPALANQHMHETLFDNEYVKYMPEAMQNLLTRTDSLRRHVACLVTVAKVG